MLFDSFTLIDLTHRLHPTVPTWGGGCGFCLEIKRDYDRTFRVQQMKLHAGIGTHMDAPCHRFENGASIAEIPLKELISPIALFNVSAQAKEDYLFPQEEIDTYEATHGQIPPGSLAIIYTGWSRHWDQPKAYRNDMRFPAISKEAATHLLQRGVSGIAIDTLSPDCLDPEFPVHQLLLGAGKYIIENIADCSKLPPKGSFAIALPLLAEKAAESPIRILALIPKSL